MSANYKDFERTIPVGGRAPIDYEGTNIAFFSASGKFKVQFDNGDESGAFEGLQLEPGKFSQVSIVNDDSVEITVELGIAEGTIRDSRLKAVGVLNSRSGSGYATLSPVSVGLSATKLADTNNSRTELHIDHQGADPIYIGDSTVTTTNGTKIEPGQKVVMSHGAETWAISGTAGQDVRLAEVTA